MSASSGYVATFLNLSYSPSELAGLTYLHNFSPGLINEARFGLTRSTGYNKGGHQGTDYSALLGIPWGPTDPRLDGFPRFRDLQLCISGRRRIPRGIYVHHQLQCRRHVDLGKRKAPHQSRRGHAVSQLNRSSAPGYSWHLKFTGSWTGQPYADFLLGLLNSDSRLNTPTIQYIRVPNYSRSSRTTGRSRHG